MNKIKAVLKYLIILIVIATVVVIAWETVRTSVVSAFESEPIIFEREIEPATEYELWLAEQDVQAELELMFKKYQRKELDDEINAIEGKV